MQKGNGLPGKASTSAATTTTKGDGKTIVNFVAGGVGGCVGAMVTQPLDVLKTRLQASSKIASVTIGQQDKLFLKTVSSLRNMFANEGIRGLFSGLVPNLVGIVPSRALYFGTYSSTKDVMKSLKFEPNSAWTHFTSAALAHTAVVLTMNPIFLVKTRIQLESVNRTQSRQNWVYLPTIRKIYRTEGIAGFYTGLTASMLGMSETVLYWVLYEKAKLLAADGMDEKQLSAWKYFTLSATVKLLASAATYPHEVVRTRLREKPQITTENEKQIVKRKYSGMINTFVRIAREEGLRGWYSGMGAHLIRVVPNTAIMFMTYEFLVNKFAPKEEFENSNFDQE